MDLLTLTLSAVILSVAFYMYITRFTFIRTVYLSMKIPGPSLWELVTVHASGLLGDNLSEHMWKMCVDFGHKPWGMWIPNGYSVVLSDFESVSQVYKNKHMTNRPDVFIEHLVEYLGKGLMTLNGEELRLHRKLIVPAFRKNLLESKLSEINDIAGQLVQQIREKGEGSLDVRLLVDNQVASMMAEIFVSVFFSFENYREILPLSFDLSVDVHKHTTNPVNYWLVHKLKKSSRLMKSYLKNTMKELCRNLASDINVYMKRRPNEPEKPMYPTDVMFKAFATFGNENGAEELLQIFIAGQDTTAFFINITLLLLAFHPEVQEKVLEEIRSTVGLVDRHAAAEDLANMGYLEMVLKEVLRLFPPVPLSMRRADEETEIGDVVIPKGSTVFTQLMAVNRDPKYFKDPLRFDPERFSTEQFQGCHSFAYFPFGGGNRGCPGQVLAIMVLKTVVCHVVRNFKILPGDDFKNVSDIPVSMYFTLKLTKSSLRFASRGALI